jgi:hypothetical protein
MLHAGLDLSRHRMDVHLMNETGEPVVVDAAPPDADGLRALTRQVAGFGQPVAAAIESIKRRPVRPRPARARRLGGRAR